MLKLQNYFLSWGMILIGVFMNVLGAYVVKLKINELGGIQFESIKTVITYFWNLASFPLAFMGGILIMAAPFPLAIALSRMELSTAYPASVGLNFIILLPLTTIFLGESLVWTKIIAIILIIISLVLLHK